MEYEEKIQRILKSSLALGHKIQDILEEYGMENERVEQPMRLLRLSAITSLRLGTRSLGAAMASVGTHSCSRQRTYLPAKAVPRKIYPI